MKMSHQGQEYDFPDNATYEQISDFFGNKGDQSQKPDNAANQALNYFKPSNDVIGDFNKTFESTVRDPLLGFAQSTANIPSFLMNLLNKTSMFGLPEQFKKDQQGNERQFPYFDVAPHNLGTQVGEAASMVFNPTMAIKGISKIPGAINALKEAKSNVGSSVNSLVNNFKPGAESEKFMKRIGEGANSTENAERIANMTNRAAQAQKSEALAHKENVITEQGKAKINAVPEKQLPEGNIDQVAKIFGRKSNDVTTEEAAELSKAIKDYREHGDFEKFKNEGEDIFRHKGLSENAEADLEHVMRIANERKLDYLSPKNENIFDMYGRGLTKKHKNFIKNKDFESAHKLESALGEKIGGLKERRDSFAGLNENEKKDLEEYIHVYKALRKDMDRLVKDMPEHVQKKWQLFKKKYKENYKPYESTKPLNKIANAKSPEDLQGIGQSEITAIYKKPTKEVQKILKDFPKKGKDYIIYNELSHLKPNDTKGIVNALNEIERSGEFAPYMSNRIRTYKKLMENKLRNKNYLSKTLKYGGSALGASALAGLGVNALNSRKRNDSRI